MKNLFKSIMMVAVAAISFTSCSNNFTEEIVTGEKIQFNVSAVNEEVTRSAFGVPSDKKYPTLWSGDEGFVLNINGADGETTKEVEATFSGDKRAVNLSANIVFDTAPETYTLYAIAPADACVSTSVDARGWQVNIPTSQTTGTLSCDPAAQILVGASETKASASETFDMTFKHAVAYGKMSLINLDLNDAKISSVAITSTVNIANRFYINQATREYSDNSGAKTITVNTTSTENIWFALAPVDVSSTELKIVVNTDKGTFTKTVNMPEDRKFELGKISTFNVNMSGIELVGPVKYELLTDANNLKVGDKVVIAAADSDLAISTTQNTNNRGQAAITKSDDKKTISDPGADVEIFTVQEGTQAETFAFKATKYAGYIYAASSNDNQLKTTATLNDNGSWRVTVDANGVATITAQGANTRNWLRYNTTSGLFNCYSATSNQADVVIYHMEGDGSAVEPEEPEVPEVPEGETATATIDFSNTNQRTSFSDELQVWQQNGITVTNNKASSTTDVANYSNPARFYANSELIVTSTVGEIVSMVFNCSATKYALSGSYDGATLTSNGEIVTVTLATPSESFTFASLANQVRVSSIVVTYLKSEGGEDVVVKQNQSLSFAQDSYTVTFGDDFSAPTATGASTTVRYSSSNTDVATVVEDTGAVTLVGVGTTTIKATAIETDEYYGAEASYTLTVNNPSSGDGDTATTGTVLWSEDFGSYGASSTTFANNKNIAGYDYSGRGGFGDNATSVTLTADASNNVRCTTSSVTNCTSGHLWFNKSTEGTLTTSAIKLYGATSLSFSHSQGTSGSLCASAYSTDGGSTWTSLGTQSGAIATKKYTFEVPVGTESIQIRLSHPSSNSRNTRVDNLVLSVN